MRLTSYQYMLISVLRCCPDIKHWCRKVDITCVFLCHRIVALYSRLYIEFTQILYRMASILCSGSKARSCFYAWLYIFCLECAFLSAVQWRHTHRDTPSIHAPQPLDPAAPCRCCHFAVRPRSWPAWTSAWCLAVSGVWCWWHHPSQWVHCHLQLYCPLSALTVSGLVLVEDGAGVARSLCKWWKRVRELCWKRGPCLAWAHWPLSWSEGAFLPWQ